MFKQWTVYGTSATRDDLTYLVITGPETKRAAEAEAKQYCPDYQVTSTVAGNVPTPPDAPAPAAEAPAADAAE